LTRRKRVAVVRLDALGDTLLSTPAIDVLCRELGAENVLVLTSPGLGSIFGELPQHRDVSPQESDEVIAQAIDQFGAETVYVFSEKRRALRAAYLSQAPERIGFDPGWTQPLRSLEVRRYLTEKFAIINSLDSSSRYHEVERYCKLVAKGLSRKSVNGGRLKFFGLGRPQVALQPDAPVGFQWARKWLLDGWPDGLLLALVARLPANCRIFVAPDEREWALELLPQERRESLVCLGDLGDYAREVATCRYLLSIDTGAVHVAAAMGVPVVDVFPESGSHHTVPRWRPWMTPHRVVLKPTFKDHSGIAALVEEVATAGQELSEILRGLASAAS
jgi:ADP-heptose:LPS heptosyltransferase